MFTKHLNSCVSCYAFSSLLFTLHFFLICFFLVFHCIFDLFIASCPIVNGHKRNRKRKRWIFSIHFARACVCECVTMCRFHFRMRNKYLLAEACLYYGTRAFSFPLFVCMRWQRTMYEHMCSGISFADLSWLYITVYFVIKKRISVKIHCIFIEIEAKNAMKHKTNLTNSVYHAYSAQVYVWLHEIWQYLLNGIGSDVQSFIWYSITLSTVPHIHIIFFLLLLRFHVVTFVVLWFRIKICRLMEQWYNKNMQFMSICVWGMWFLPLSSSLISTIPFNSSCDIPNIMKHWGRTKTRISRKKER